MSKSRHIPISRDGVKLWCSRAFEAGMTAQSKREGTPQRAFDAWWESMAGADKRKRGAKQ